MINIRPWTIFKMIKRLKSPDVCVGEIFQALLAFSNKSGLKKVFSHVVPHLLNKQSMIHLGFLQNYLEVIGGKMTRRPPMTFVFNFQIGVAALGKILTYYV